MDNYIDLGFAFVFFITWGFDIGFGTHIPEDSRAEYTRIMLALLLLFGFLKGLATMRAFTQFSFIVRMVVVVVAEMIPFLSLFFMFTFVCAMVMYVLGVHLGTDPEPGEVETVYSGLGFLGHVIFTLQNSLGAFEMQPIADLKQTSNACYWFAWLFWLFIVLINLIVFLNFLIALIGDVYSKVMLTKR